MRKTILLLAFTFFGITIFGAGYIAGHIAGFDEGCKKTLGEIYRLHNVKQMPMNKAIEIAGAGDQGMRKVWESRR